LPKYLKKDIGHDLVFYLIPVILIGFKLHTKDIFCSDSNSVQQAASFIEKIWRKKNLNLYVYLCAHRGHGTETRKHCLVEHIPENFLDSSFWLVSSLVKASQLDTHSRITIQQQEASVMTSMSMFPAMFVEYAKRGEVENMLNLINRHTSLISKKALLATEPHKMEIICEGLDTHTLQVMHLLEMRYGKEWRQLSFKTVSANDPFVAIAHRHGLPQVQRYSLGWELLITEAQKSAEIHQGSKLANECLQWFLNHMQLTREAKALYEVCFYYVLGNKIASEQGIYLGLERDHTKLQYDALNLGMGNTANAAYLYARRTKDALTQEGIGLSKISFRQFWR
jgi:hypothetical protein